MTRNKKTSLRYTRNVTLIQNDNPATLAAELSSFKAKNLLQQWFPMQNGLGFVLDEKSGKYVIE